MPGAERDKMTRRQHTTLILQVRIPVPAGKTQAQTLEWVKQQLILPSTPQTQVKITGRETTYL